MPEHRTLTMRQREAINDFAAYLPTSQERRYVYALEGWLDGRRLALPDRADFGLTELCRAQIDGVVHAIKRALRHPLDAGVEPQHPTSATARLIDGVTTDEALDRIHAVLSGRMWSGADDMQIIAEIIESTGRRVLPPVDDDA